MGTTQTRIHPALHVDVLSMAGSRIADELFNQRRRISVGRSTKNTIVLPDEEAPPSLPLFRRSRAGFTLHYDDGMRGHVRRDDDEPWRELAELHDDSKQHHHAYDLDLREGARGRVEVGNETVVFEVVPGPEPLVLPSRARSFALMAAALLLAGGVIIWIFLRPPAKPIAPAAQVAPAAQIAPAAPIAQPASPVIEAPKPIVQPVTAKPVTAQRRSVTKRYRGNARPEVALTGTLRSVGPFPIPKVDLVSTPPRSERMFARSPYTPDGLLRPEIVVASINQEKGGVAADYERALRDNPRLRGELVARVRIDRDGNVTRVEIVSDTLGSIRVRRRLETMLGNWHAPLPTAAPAEYELPFAFRALTSTRP